MLITGLSSALGTGNEHYYNYYNVDKGDKDKIYYYKTHFHQPTNNSQALHGINVPSQGMGM